MKLFRADLHIHTVLSPCGDLEMSPKNIVMRALQQKMDILGITDHNSTRQCRLLSQIAEAKGIFVLPGAEITSREEVHCVAFMPGWAELEGLQQYLDQHLGNVMNDVDKFGYQVVVDENENIVYEEPKLLIQSIDQSVEEIEAFVHSLGGLFIPAHVNRPTFSLISQLGFVPDDLNYDALELSKHIIRSSDAHFLKNVGEVFTGFYLEEASFQEIKMALLSMDGRKAGLAIASLKAVMEK